MKLLESFKPTLPGPDGLWVFCLEEDITFFLPQPVDNYKNEYITIRDNRMTVHAPFFWNGCNPKRKFLGKIWGTWDGPINKETGLPATYYASLAHDVLCYFEDICDVETADLIFHDLMDGFILQKPYYWAVVGYHKLPGTAF